MKNVKDTRKCKLCKSDIPDSRMQCPVCKRFQPFAGAAHTDTTVTLTQVKARKISRLVTGPWDECFGGGLAVGSVNLIGGEPGGGKSTFSLQLADAVVEKTGLSCFYISSEEEAGQIQDRAKRLGVKHLDAIRVHDINNETDIEFAIKKHNPILIVTDSISGLCGTDFQAAVDYCYSMKQIVTRMGAVAIVIDQITKDGNFHGAQALLHAVDGTFTMFGGSEDGEGGDKDEESDSDWEDNEDASPDIRELYTVKNRNGPARKKVAFEMTEKGLIAI